MQNWQLQEILWKNTLRKLENHLKDHRLVKQFSVLPKSKKIRVWFIDGIKEYWCMGKVPDGTSRSFKLPKADLYTEFEPPRLLEFESDPLDQSSRDRYAHHFFYRNIDFQRTGFVQSRLLVHELIDELVTAGWRELRYPDLVLRREALLASHWDYNDSWYGNSCFSMTPPGPGRKFYEHFFTIENIKKGRKQRTVLDMWKPKKLYYAIEYLLREEQDLTLSKIVWKLGRIEGCSHIPLIGFWRAIFQKYKVRAIKDMDPQFGDKLMAAHISRIRYEAPGAGQEIQQMAAYFGKPFESHHTQTVILNENLQKPADDLIRGMEPWMGSGNQLMVLVPFEIRNKLTRTFPPRDFVPLSFVPQIPDHFLLIY